MTDELAAEHLAVAECVLKRHAELDRVREVLEGWAPVDVERFQVAMDAPLRDGESRVRRVLSVHGLPEGAGFVADTLDRLTRTPEAEDMALAVRRLAGAVVELTRNRQGYLYSLSLQPGVSEVVQGPCMLGCNAPSSE